MRPRSGRFVPKSASKVADIRLELHKDAQEGSAGLLSGDVHHNGKVISFYSAPRGKDAVTQLTLTSDKKRVRVAADVRFGALNFETGTWGTASIDFTSRTTGTLRLKCPRGGNKCDISLPVKWRDGYFRDLTIEIDRSPLAVFPNKKVNWRNVKWDLAKIFRASGFRTRVRLNDTGVVEQENGWLEGELDDALAQYRSPNLTPWYVHVLLVSRFEEESDDTFGYMFDMERRSKNPAREGCAVFVNALKHHFGSGAQYHRELLMTIAHEVGHALNLLHSFDKDRADSPSLMNYPEEYSFGSKKYYNAFEFTFDRWELHHLRHNSATVTEPGNANGVPFGIHSQRIARSRARRKSLMDRPANPKQQQFEQDCRNDLALTLSIADSNLLPGEPVTGRVTLKRAAGSRLRVKTSLDWRTGYLAVQVRRAGSAEWITKAPPLRRCAHLTTARFGTRPLTRDFTIVRTVTGDLFEGTGDHEMRVRLTLTGDGVRAQVFSPPVSVQIADPGSPDEVALAQILSRHDVKRLLTLRGGVSTEGARQQVAQMVQIAPARPGGQFAALALATDMTAQYVMPAGRPSAAERKRATDTVSDLSVMAGLPQHAEGDVRAATANALLQIAAGGSVGNHLAREIELVRRRL